MRWSLLLCMVMACSSRSTISWQLAFDSEALRERVITIEARIFQDDCDGAELYSETFRQSDHPALPPRLERSRYCFHARAIDDDCIAYAEGRTVITLSRAEDPIEVVLGAPEDGEAPSCVVGEQCNAGACEPVGDGGADADGGNACMCDPDVDGDGMITTIDFLSIQACRFDPTMAGCENADLDCNGVFDNCDQSIVECSEVSGDEASAVALCCSSPCGACQSETVCMPHEVRVHCERYGDFQGPGSTCPDAGTADAGASDAVDS